MKAETRRKYGPPIIKMRLALGAEALWNALSGEMAAKIKSSAMSVLRAANNPKKREENEVMAIESVEKFIYQILFLTKDFPDGV